ncbi:uncharacterized protein LOC102363160 [Latimeria chalumnae]|uniref:uncharacterized protein LOC102363160 n=1 Tax=Latimeria chalumnae TaxID=7897 RepID=UPI00313B15CC
MVTFQQEQALLQKPALEPVTLNSAVKRETITHVVDQFPPVNVPGMVIYSQSEPEKVPSSRISSKIRHDLAPYVEPQSKTENILEQLAAEQRCKRSSVLHTKCSKEELGFPEKELAFQRHFIPKGSFLEKLFQKKGRKEAKVTGNVKEVEIVNILPQTTYLVQEQLKDVKQSTKGFEVQEIASETAIFPSKLNIAAKTIVSTILFKYGLMGAEETNDTDKVAKVIDTAAAVFPKVSGTVFKEPTLTQVRSSEATEVITPPTFPVDLISNESLPFKSDYKLKFPEKKAESFEDSPSASLETLLHTVSRDSLVTENGVTKKITSDQWEKAGWKASEVDLLANDITTSVVEKLKIIKSTDSLQEKVKDTVDPSAGKCFTYPGKNSWKSEDELLTSNSCGPIQSKASDSVISLLSNELTNSVLFKLQKSISDMELAANAVPPLEKVIVLPARYSSPKTTVHIEPIKYVLSPCQMPTEMEYNTLNIEELSSSIAEEIISKLMENKIVVDQSTKKKLQVASTQYSINSNITTAEIDRFSHELSMAIISIIVKKLETESTSNVNKNTIFEQVGPSYEIMPEESHKIEISDSASSILANSVVENVIDELVKSQETETVTKGFWSPAAYERGQETETLRQSLLPYPEEFNSVLPKREVSSVATRLDQLVSTDSELSLVSEELVNKVFNIILESNISQEQPQSAIVRYPLCLEIEPMREKNVSSIAESIKKAPDICMELAQISVDTSHNILSELGVTDFSLLLLNVVAETMVKTLLENCSLFPGSLPSAHLPDCAQKYPLEENDYLKETKQVDGYITRQENGQPTACGTKVTVKIESTFIDAQSKMKLLQNDQSNYLYESSLSLLSGLMVKSIMERTVDYLKQQNKPITSVTKAPSEPNISVVVAQKPSPLVLSKKLDKHTIPKIITKQKSSGTLNLRGATSTKLIKKTKSESEFTPIKKSGTDSITPKSKKPSTSGKATLDRKLQRTAEKPQFNLVTEKTFHITDKKSEKENKEDSLIEQTIDLLSEELVNSLTDQLRCKMLEMTLETKGSINRFPGTTEVMASKEETGISEFHLDLISEDIVRLILEQIRYTVSLNKREHQNKGSALKSVFLQESESMKTEPLSDKNIVLTKGKSSPKHKSKTKREHAKVLDAKNIDPYINIGKLVSQKQMVNIATSITDLLQNSSLLSTCELQKQDLDVVCEELVQTVLSEVEKKPEIIEGLKRENQRLIKDSIDFNSVKVKTSLERQAVQDFNLFKQNVIKCLSEKLKEKYTSNLVDFKPTDLHLKLITDETVHFILEQISNSIDFYWETSQISERKSLNLKAEELKQIQKVPSTKEKKTQLSNKDLSICQTTPLQLSKTKSTDYKIESEISQLDNTIFIITPKMLKEVTCHTTSILVEKAKEIYNCIPVVSALNEVSQELINLVVKFLEDSHTKKLFKVRKPLSDEVVKCITDNVKNNISAEPQICNTVMFTSPAKTKVKKIGTHPLVSYVDLISEDIIRFILEQIYSENKLHGLETIQKIKTPATSYTPFSPKDFTFEGVVKKEFTPGPLRFLFTHDIVLDITNSLVNLLLMSFDTKAGVPKITKLYQLSSDLFHHIIENIENISTLSIEPDTKVSKENIILEKVDAIQAEKGAMTKKTAMVLCMILSNKELMKCLAGQVQQKLAQIELNPVASDPKGQRKASLVTDIDLVSIEAVEFVVAAIKCHISLKLTSMEKRDIESVSDKNVFPEFMSQKDTETKTPSKSLVNDATAAIKLSATMSPSASTETGNKVSYASLKDVISQDDMLKMTSQIKTIITNKSEVLPLEKLELSELDNTVEQLVTDIIKGLERRPEILCKITDTCRGSLISMKDFCEMSGTKALVSESVLDDIMLELPGQTLSSSVDDLDSITKPIIEGVKKSLSALSLAKMPEIILPVTKSEQKHRHVQAELSYSMVNLIADDVVKFVLQEVKNALILSIKPSEVLTQITAFVKKSDNEMKPIVGKLLALESGIDFPSSDAQNILPAVKPVQNIGAKTTEEDTSTVKLKKSPSKEIVLDSYKMGPQCFKTEPCKSIILEIVGNESKSTSCFPFQPKIKILNEDARVELASDTLKDSLSDEAVFDITSGLVGILLKNHSNTQVSETKITELYQLSKSLFNCVIENIERRSRILTESIAQVSTENVNIEEISACNLKTKCTGTRATLVINNILCNKDIVKCLTKEIRQIWSQKQLVPFQDSSHIKELRKTPSFIYANLVSEDAIDFVITAIKWHISLIRFPSIISLEKVEAVTLLEEDSHQEFTSQKSLKDIEAKKVSKQTMDESSAIATLSSFMSPRILDKPNTKASSINLKDVISLDMLKLKSQVKAMLIAKDSEGLCLQEAQSLELEYVTEKFVQGIVEMLERRPEHFLKITDAYRYSLVSMKDFCEMNAIKAFASSSVLDDIMLLPNKKQLYLDDDLDMFTKLITKDIKRSLRELKCSKMSESMQSVKLEQEYKQSELKFLELILNMITEDIVKFVIEEVICTFILSTQLSKMLLPITALITRNENEIKPMDDKLPFEEFRINFSPSRKAMLSADKLVQQPDLEISEENAACSLKQFLSRGTISDIIERLVIVLTKMSSVFLEFVPKISELYQVSKELLDCVVDAIEKTSSILPKVKEEKKTGTVVESALDNLTILDTVLGSKDLIESLTKEVKQRLQEKVEKLISCRSFSRTKLQNKISLFSYTDLISEDTVEFVTDAIKHYISLGLASEASLEKKEKALVFVEKPDSQLIPEKLSKHCEAKETSKNLLVQIPLCETMPHEEGTPSDSSAKMVTITDLKSVLSEDLRFKMISHVEEILAERLSGVLTTELSHQSVLSDTANQLVQSVIKELENRSGLLIRLTETCTDPLASHLTKDKLYIQEPVAQTKAIAQTERLTSAENKSDSLVKVITEIVKKNLSTLKWENILSYGQSQSKVIMVQLKSADSLENAITNELVRLVLDEILSSFGIFMNSGELRHISETSLIILNPLATLDPSHITNDLPKTKIVEKQSEHNICKEDSLVFSKELGSNEVLSTITVSLAKVLSKKRFPNTTLEMCELQQVSKELLDTIIEKICSLKSHQEQEFVPEEVIEILSTILSNKNVVKSLTAQIRQRLLEKELRSSETVARSFSYTDFVSEDIVESVIDAIKRNYCLQRLPSQISFDRIKMTEMACSYATRKESLKYLTDGSSKYFLHDKPVSIKLSESILPREMIGEKNRSKSDLFIDLKDGIPQDVIHNIASHVEAILAKKSTEVLCLNQPLQTELDYIALKLVQIIIEELQKVDSLTELSDLMVSKKDTASSVKIHEPKCSLLHAMTEPIDVNNINKDAALCTLVKPITKEVKRSLSLLGKSSADLTNFQPQTPMQHSFKISSSLINIVSDDIVKFVLEQIITAFNNSIKYPKTYFEKPQGENSRVSVPDSSVPHAALEMAEKKKSQISLQYRWKSLLSKNIGDIIVTVANILAQRNAKLCCLQKDLEVLSEKLVQCVVGKLEKKSSKFFQLYKEKNACFLTTKCTEPHTVSSLDVPFSTSEEEMLKTNNLNYDAQVSELAEFATSDLRGEDVSLTGLADGKMVSCGLNRSKPDLESDAIVFPPQADQVVLSVEERQDFHKRNIGVTEKAAFEKQSSEPQLLKVVNTIFSPKVIKSVIEEVKRCMFVIPSCQLFEETEARTEPKPCTSVFTTQGLHDSCLGLITDDIIEFIIENIKKSITVYEMATDKFVDKMLQVDLYVRDEKDEDYLKKSSEVLLYSTQEAAMPYNPSQPWIIKPPENTITQPIESYISQEELIKFLSEERVENICDSVRDVLSQKSSEILGHTLSQSEINLFSTKIVQNIIEGLRSPPNLLYTFVPVTHTSADHINSPVTGKHISNLIKSSSIGGPFRSQETLTSKLKVYGPEKNIKTQQKPFKVCSQQLQGLCKASDGSLCSKSEKILPRILSKQKQREMENPKRILQPTDKVKKTFVVELSEEKLKDTNEHKKEKTEKVGTELVVKTIEAITPLKPKEASSVESILFSKENTVFSKVKEIITKVLSRIYLPGSNIDTVSVSQGTAPGTSISKVACKLVDSLLENLQTQEMNMIDGQEQKIVMTYPEVLEQVVTSIYNDILQKYISHLALQKNVASEGLVWDKIIVKSIVRKLSEIYLSDTGSTIALPHSLPSEKADYIVKMILDDIQQYSGQMLELTSSKIESSKKSGLATDLERRESFSRVEPQKVLDKPVRKILVQSNHQVTGPLPMMGCAYVEDGELQALPLQSPSVTEYDLGKCDSPNNQEITGWHDSDTCEMLVKIIPHIKGKPILIDPWIISEHLSVFSVKTEPLEVLQKQCLLETGQSIKDLRRSSISGKRVARKQEEHSTFNKDSRIGSFRRASLDNSGKLAVRPKEVVCRNSFRCVQKPEISKVELLKDVQNKQDLIISLVTHDITQEEEGEETGMEVVIGEQAALDRIEDEIKFLTKVTEQTIATSREKREDIIALDVNENFSSKILYDLDVEKKRYMDTRLQRKQSSTASFDTKTTSPRGSLENISPNTADDLEIKPRDRKSEKCKQKSVSFHDDKESKHDFISVRKVDSSKTKIKLSSALKNQTSLQTDEEFLPDGKKIYMKESKLPAGGQFDHFNQQLLKGISSVVLTPDNLADSEDAFLSNNLVHGVLQTELDPMQFTEQSLPQETEELTSFYPPQNVKEQGSKEVTLEHDKFFQTTGYIGNLYEPYDEVRSFTSRPQKRNTPFQVHFREIATQFPSLEQADCRYETQDQTVVYAEEMLPSTHSAAAEGSSETRKTPEKSVLSKVSNTLSKVFSHRFTIPGSAKNEPQNK